MQRILHVFPNWPSLASHLCDAVASDDFDSLNKSAARYTNKDGSVHHCFAIRERDDVHQFIGHEFSGFEKHGDFSHLSLDDQEYLELWLARRVRKAVA